MHYEYVCRKKVLAEIDYEKEDFKTVLSQKYKPQQIESKDFERILNMDFMEHWFLDSEYSTEFEEFLKNLNKKLKSDTENADLDEEVSRNTDVIFYEEEKKIWRERLLVCAYLKMTDKKDDEAALLYGIYLDEKMLPELYVNILRKSVYEYYFSLKFNTEENQNRFTLGELDKIIEKIEEKWVKNV